MKILLAVDGSKYTKKMLAYLSTHDDLFGTSHRYTAFTAQPPLPPLVRSAVGREIVNSYYADETKKVLAPVCKFMLRHGIDANSSWKVGLAGEAISKFAMAGKFDLLVMGSRGHGAWSSLVMGSVVNQVLANCRVPVLLIR